VAVLSVEDADGVPFGTVLGFGCHPTNVDLPDRYSADYVGVLREELGGAFGADHHTAFASGRVANSGRPTSRRGSNRWPAWGRRLRPT